MHESLYKNVNENMGFVLRKSDFVVCEQQRCISGCLYAQSDLHFCYWLSGKDYGFICYIQNFNILASLHCRAGLFEHYVVRDPKDSFLASMSTSCYDTYSSVRLVIQVKASAGIVVSVNWLFMRNRLVKLVRLQNVVFSITDIRLSPRYLQYKRYQSKLVS